MRKLFLLIALWCCCVVSAVAQAPAQLTPTQAREAEWQGYAVPTGNFVRRKNTEDNIVFRVPADWKQETSMSFAGPHSATINVYVQQIPDGYSLQEYFTSLLQIVRDNASTADATLTRKTQIQDLEAREIFLENANAEGDVIRSTSWIVVDGPLAITLNFQAPVAHAAELEPFFKGVVQSVVILPREHAAFEALRNSELKPGSGGPIHELESIVASLNEMGVDREPVVTRLAAFFSSQPDAAIDLLVDRRPAVRATAVQALVRAKNDSLAPFLWEIVDDKDPLVAEPAARVVATKPNVIDELITRSMYGHEVELIARVWSFMPKEKRLDLLQRIFSQTATRPSPSPQPAGPKPPAGPEVSVTVKELRPVKPGETPPPATRAFSNDPNVQMGALTLLIDVPREEFKLPLERIVASNNDQLIALALQVSLWRSEVLPVEPLLKLVKSADQLVSKAAAQCLSIAAGVADIPRLEALISKDSTEATKAVDDELKLSIRKLRFRYELGAAKNDDEKRAIITRAYSDAALANFAWLFDCEATVAGCKTATIKPDLAIKPLAENLFPKKVRHYVAIPKPGEAVGKFYETLQGLQLDSARSQANLVLVLNGMRMMMAQQLSAPAGAPALLEYTGLDTNAPIALGSWTANGAADSTRYAERRAIVLRVKDRARFERLVQQLQTTGGSLAYMTDYLALGTRGIAAMPAFLPLTAQAIMSVGTGRNKAKPVRETYSLIGDQEWNGLHIRTIEQRRLNGDGQLETYVTYLTYFGDTAIVTADLPSLRELLNNEGRASLAENAEFRKTVEQRGDVVYFSDLRAVFADASESGKPIDFKINESGRLNITNTSWENTHHLVFDESDWTKPLAPFHPKDLSAPRELLPASTIVYFLTTIDLKLGWSGKIRTSFLPDDKDVTSLFALNFKDDVLPELGPECGVAVLELPGVLDHENDSWAAFCKLKSNKLVEALNAGKLFANVGPAKDVAQLKLGAVPYFVAARNGFLIVSNREQGIAAFDGKTNLAAARDYARAVEAVPGNLLAFGGYNLEAAVAAARKSGGEGLNGQIANIIFSIASAFHSQNFYATATPGSIEAHSSVSMDREGRYSVSDFSELSKGGNVTFATIEPAGLPIADQNRLSSLVLRVKAKAAGPIENIKDDLKTPDQTVEVKSANELLLRIAARRGDAAKSVALPVKEAEFAPYLKSTAEFNADDENVKKQAREIAGEDHDAWSVAQKLADWTHQNLEWKVVANADVGQTLATREADCSEFSALFVAMARSLGLPARIVSGLAYSGDSFGGHAWVEVWTGKWTELDPTWGTHFVDATHIRNESGALVTSAALNLIELEVLEARRSVTEFQKTPLALTQHLLKAIPTADRSDLEAVLDVGVLTDELMGAGTWSKMNDAERNQMSSAYRRALHEIVDGYGRKSLKIKMRLLHLEEKGGAAEATCVLYDWLLKLRLIRRDDVWYLAEIVQSDTNLHTVAEAVQPTITAIENARAGRKAIVPRPDVSRVLILLQTDVAKAVAFAESALKSKPNDQTLRMLKAVALLRLNANKSDEAIKLLRELSNENFAPAIYRLASQLSQSDDEKELAEAITLFKRYTELEPYDARGFRDLATAANDAEEPSQAEPAYRKVVELNPTDVDGYVKLIQFLVMQERVPETKSVLAAADKFKDDDTDVFGEVMENLFYDSDSSIAIPFAVSETERLEKSAQANIALGRLLFEENRYADALLHLRAAAVLDKKSSTPHVVMARVYRQQRRYTLALRAARQAIALDDTDGEAYYQLACTLARLARLKEAMAALEKAIELYPEQAEWMADEKDLKPLANLPAFKKLAAPEPEKK